MMVIVNPAVIFRPPSSHGFMRRIIVFILLFRTVFRIVFSVSVSSGTLQVILADFLGYCLFGLTLPFDFPSEEALLLWFFTFCRIFEDNKILSVGINRGLRTRLIFSFFLSERIPYFSRNGRIGAELFRSIRTYIRQNNMLRRIPDSCREVSGYGNIAKNEYFIFVFSKFKMRYKTIIKLIGLYRRTNFMQPESR